MGPCPVPLRTNREEASGIYSHKRMQPLQQQVSTNLQNCRYHRADYLARVRPPEGRLSNPTLTIVPQLAQLSTRQAERVLRPLSPLDAIIRPSPCQELLSRGHEGLALSYEPSHLIGALERHTRSVSKSTSHPSPPLRDLDPNFTACSGITGTENALRASE